MNSPFILMRLAMAAAVIGVIGLVAWLIYQDGSKGDAEDEANRKSDVQTFRSTEDVIERGTVEDLLVHISQLGDVPRDAAYIRKVTHIRNKILIYRELVSRSDELDEELRAVAKRDLLGSLLELYTTNMKEQVVDEELRKELNRVANEISAESDNEIRRDAEIILTSVPVLDVFDRAASPTEVDIAKSKIQELFENFPDDPIPANAMYELIKGFGVHDRDYDSAIELLKLVNQLCAQSSDERVKELGNNYEGYVLLVKHRVLDLKPGLNLFQSDDPDELMAKIEAFLLEDYGMSRPVADVILNIGGHLENWGRNDEAAHVYGLLRKRIGEQSEYDKHQAALDRGIRRMTAVGEILELPEIEEGKHTFVIFVSDSSTSEEVAVMLANSRIVDAERSVNAVIVSNSSDIESLEQRMVKEHIQGVKIIADPNSESAYSKLYPAEFFPSLIIVGPDRRIMDVNVDNARVETFLKTLGNTQ